MGCILLGCLAYHKFNTAIGPSVKLVITNITENNKKTLWSNISICDAQNSPYSKVLAGRLILLNGLFKFLEYY